MADLSIVIKSQNSSPSFLIQVLANAASANPLRFQEIGALGFVAEIQSGTIATTIPAVDCSAQNCSSCLALPACGWCTRTATCGPGSSNMPAPSFFSQCPVYTLDYLHGPDAQCPGPCGSHTNCVSCATRRDCVYCEGNNKCVPYAEMLSGKATCRRSGVSEQFREESQQCAVNRCPALIQGVTGPCPKCVADPGCGWCKRGSSVSCKAGDSMGATDGQCATLDSSWHFTDCGQGATCSTVSCAAVLFALCLAPEQLHLRLLRLFLLLPLPFFLLPILLLLLRPPTCPSPCPIHPLHPRLTGHAKNASPQLEPPPCLALSADGVKAATAAARPLPTCPVP